MVSRMEIPGDIMTVKITYRLDEYDEYMTDCTVMVGTTWEQVFAEVRSIEAHATVLTIERASCRG
jgi:hypothetical protein